MKARKVKGKNSKRWQKVIIGILLALIMVVSVVSILTHSTTGSDITQTTVRNGYIVNPDNVMISIDENTTAILIGQNVQFMCEGSKTGTVTATGVEGTPAEGYVVTSDSTGWLDTSMMVEGLYNATYEEHWELLAVSTPVMDLGLKVDGYEVNSIVAGTPLGIDFTSNLGENDCVDLRVIDPDGNLIKVINNQKFGDINVTQLLGYGSENESKRINTTGWNLGTYRFSVRTEEENARGLDVSNYTRTLAVCKAEINIETEKWCVVELEKVRLTVWGVYNHNITISSSDHTHMIFPAGYEDNPPYTTSGFNDTIDEDGQRRYVVYFNETGTYTITVTDTTAGLDDTVDISILEKAVTFDVPTTVVIGEKLDIKGIANTGTTIDVWVDDILYAKLNDLVIEDNGTFSEEVNTTEVGMTVPGAVRLKAWVDCPKNPGDDPPTTPDDGSVVILVVVVRPYHAFLNATLSKATVPPGDTFEVYGNASSNYVEIVAISPKGGNGTGIDGLYGVSIYTVPTFISTNSSSNNGVRMEEDEIDINVSKQGIIFDMPTTCIIGENLTINGTANAGDSIDIAINDKIMAIDIPINENGTFNTEISTIGYIPGSYKIEGFIDGNYLIGEDVSGQESDGSTAIRLISPDLTVNISTNITASGGTVIINGTATGTDHVDIITISPKGGNGTGLYEKSYPEVPGITNETIPVENNSFSKTINLSGCTIPTPTPGGRGGGGVPRDSDGDGISDIDEMLVGTDPNNPCDPNPECAACLATRGAYIIWVSVPGHNGGYGAWSTAGNASELINHIIDYYCGGNATELRSKTQAQILAMLRDATIDMAGSDDLIDVGYILIESAYVKLDPIKDVSIGEGLVVTGTTNRRDGCLIVVKVKGPMELQPQTVYVENGTFKAVFDTSYALPGVYTVKADDGDGHTDETAVNIFSVMHNFYKKIKVDSGADTGNYTILVLSPGMDGIYGNSSYKYIDSMLDLDGAGPELGAIDVSNKTQEEIVGIIKDVTIDQAGSDDLFWKGHLIVCQPIYVDDDFEDDPANHRWNTIQEGINDANDGDIVYVYNGTYYENLVVNKTITLQGEDRDTTAIDGGGSVNVVHVTADNCVFSGFTVQNNSGFAYHAGIKICSSKNEISNNIITNDTASHNWVGIWLLSSNNNILADNIINAKIEPLLLNTGIVLSESNNNMLINNSISNVWFGIDVFLSSDYNTITNTSIKSTGFGIAVHSSSNNKIYHNNIINNTNQAYDNGNNSWDNGYPSGGNYWSDWTSPDNYSGVHQNESGSDGIVDNPYLISGGVNQDCYPFVNPDGWLDTISPVVTITSPVNGSVVTTPNVTVIGNATDDAGIVTMCYGHVCKGKGGGGGCGYLANSSIKVSINWTVYHLCIGWNIISVTAIDAAGNAGNASVMIIYKEENVSTAFDTGQSSNPYPSISGIHNGTITPNQTITVSKLYTYPCAGTGGHTEYAAFYYPNGTIIAEAHWNGYTGDWHNITFNNSFTLYENETYHYTIRTGSYPQIIHTSALPTVNGWINCTEFTDANGKKYNNWIPAIRLE